MREGSRGSWKEQNRETTELCYGPSTFELFFFKKQKFRFDAPSFMKKTHLWKHCKSFSIRRESTGSKGGRCYVSQKGSQIFAHKEIWRPFRQPVAFSDMETSRRRKTVCPRSHGFRVQPGFFTPSLMILFHISKLPRIFTMRNGSLLPFSLWVLTSVLFKSPLCPLTSSAH